MDNGVECVKLYKQFFGLVELTEEEVERRAHEILESDDAKFQEIKEKVHYFLTENGTKGRCLPRFQGIVRAVRTQILFPTAHPEIKGILMSIEKAAEIQQAVELKSIRNLSEQDFELLMLEMAFKGKVKNLILPNLSLQGPVWRHFYAYYDTPPGNYLQYLNISGNNIGAQGYAAISYGLQHNLTSLKTLIIGGNPMTMADAIEIRRGLDNNQSLTALDMEGNHIDSQMIYYVLGSRSLVHLNVASNRIDRNGAAVLAERLSQRPHFDTLNIDSNDVADAGITTILGSLPRIINLRARSNNIGNVGAQGIAQCLQNNYRLKHLDLRRNQISEQGCLFIGEALPINRNLEVLDLSQNPLGDGVNEIWRGLQGNSTLHSLSMMACRLTKNSMDGVRIALQNSELKTLFISHNNLQGFPLQNVLGTHLETLNISSTHSNITSLPRLCNPREPFTNLNFSGLGITNAIVIKIAKQLFVNNRLQVLNLSFNGVGPEGVKALATTLATVGTSSVLETLHLLHVPIRDEGAIALAEAIAVNCSLKTLELGHNGITSVGARALGQALATNSTLTTLRLHDFITEAIPDFADALRTNRTLKTLALETNNPNILVDFTPFVEVLAQHNHTLTDLSTNAITDRGVFLPIQRELSNNKRYYELRDTRLKRNFASILSAVDDEYEQSMLNTISKRLQHFTPK